MAEAGEKFIPLGEGKCVLCASDKAKYRVSLKNQLAYLVCSACGTQLFCRQGRSDELLRGRLSSAPVADPVPVNPSPKSKGSENDPPPVPAAKPEKKKSSAWDIYA